MKKTLGHNYLKQQHFELFPKSWGSYSLRSDPDPVFFSEVGSGSANTGYSIGPLPGTLYGAIFGAP
jgi:hypothetical protein